jgi:hypothetical protein
MRFANPEPAVPTPRRESSGTLFIELEEWRGTAWNQISRSNHALAEERTEGAGAWSSPHLPTISVSALSDLRARLNESTIFINLVSPTLTAAAEHMLSKQLPEEHIAAAVLALQSRGSAPPLSPVRPEGSPSKQKQDKYDEFHMLDPEGDEEAFELMLAHVDFLTAPALALARLATPIDVGCEGGTPVRFLFLLIGPADAAEASTKMAQALAGIFLDEKFAAFASKCASAAAFLSALDTHLESVSVLPHVHAYPHALPHAGAGAGAPAAAPFSLTDESSHGSGHTSDVEGMLDGAVEVEQEEVDEDSIVLAEVEG